MIVVDASALIELLLRLPAARVVQALLLDGGEALHAPCLIDIEVTQAVRRYAMRGDIDDAWGATALADLAALPIQRHAHLPLLQRVWRLRHNLTAYDATYAALAEALDATLVTRDAGLAATTQDLARVVLV